MAEALAQTPNPQAVIDQTAHFYLNQGVLGATCLVFIGISIGLCLVIRALYRDLKTTNAAAIADRDKLITAQQAAATAAEKGVAALESLKATLTASTDASEDLTRQVELATQETRHAVGNILTAINGLVGRSDRGRS